MPETVPDRRHTTTRHTPDRRTPDRRTAPAPRGAGLRWWTELPLIALVYAAYSAGRLLVRGDVSAAVGHGLDILALERWLHLNAEHPLNRLFTDQPGLGVPAAFVYASLHYLVTPAILVLLWRRRPGNYRAARTWLLLSTALGLAGFALFPTCPPRLLAARHGFADTMAQYASYGWWGGEASAPRGLGGLTNQYAAMPSLHVGWALWCGVLIWRYGRGVPAKVLGVGYPLLITVVVMGTANHYFLDAVAGTAVMGTGLLLTRPGLRLAARVRARTKAAAAPAGCSSSTVVSGECDTSAGERIPRQPSRDGRPVGAVAAGPATAGDGTPAAAR